MSLSCWQFWWRYAKVVSSEYPLIIGCILSNSIISWVQEAKEIKSIGSVVCCSSCQLLFLIVIGWVVVLFHVGAYCSRFSPSCRSGTLILCTGTYSLVGRVLVLVLDKKYLYLKCTGNIHTYLLRISWIMNSSTVPIMQHNFSRESRLELWD